MKKIMFWGLLTFCGLLMAGEFVHSGFDIDYLDNKEKICGIVVHKSEELHQLKYATEHNMYLTICCDDGSYKDVNVTTHAYLSTEKGERVCYIKNSHGIGSLFMALCAFCFCLSVFGAVILLIWGIAEFYTHFIE